MKNIIFKYLVFGVSALMSASPSHFIHSSLNSKLESVNQQHLLRYWDQLSEQEKASLNQQIDDINLSAFSAQRKTLSDPLICGKDTISPFRDFIPSGSESMELIGQQLINEGKVGCLVIAGGQGSRLGHHGPKGVFEVTKIKNKSLFQLVAERVRAAGIKAKRPLLLAVMTSKLNHEETVSFFKDNNFFGLEPTQLFFYSQKTLPFLNEDGELFLEERAKIAEGPDGNAPSLKQFVDQGLWQDWYNKGIRYVSYIPIDNPLADPFDAELIGVVHQENCDVVVKCIARDNPNESVGVIVNKNGKVGVIEYSEITPEDRLASDEKGCLQHRCANISLFGFKMEFIRYLADECYAQFPYHKAWKAVKYLNDAGDCVASSQPNAWKFERFIFDLLPFAKNVKAILYPREVCFAPLKNAKGPDSLESVRVAMQNYDRCVYKKISGIDVNPDRDFELDPQFYYPTEEMKKKWKGQSLPTNAYVRP